MSWIFVTYGREGFQPSTLSERVVLSLALMITAQRYSHSIISLILVSILTIWTGFFDKLGSLNRPVRLIVLNDDSNGSDVRKVRLGAGLTVRASPPGHITRCSRLSILYGGLTELRH